MAKKFTISAKFTGDATDLISTTKRLGQNLKTTGDLFTQFGRQATAAMAAVNAAFIGSAAAGARLADQYAKTSFRLGTNVTALRELSFAAEQSGAGLGSIQTAFRRLSVNALDAANNLEEAKRNFRDAGVSFTTAEGKLKPLDTLFKEIAIKLGNMESITKRQGIAMKLLGRSGDQLAPLFEALARNSESFANQLKLVNAQLDEQTAALGEDVVDAFGLWKKSIEGVTFAMLRALGPTLERVLIHLSATIGTLSRLIDKNKELVLKIAKIVAVVGALVTAFTTWSIAVAAVGSAISAFATFLAGPVASTFFTTGLIVTGLAFLMIKMAQASEAARVTVLSLTGSISALGFVAASAAGNVRGMIAALVGLAGSIAIFELAPKLAEVLAELDKTFEKLQKEIAALEKAFKKLGGAAGVFGDEVDPIEKKLRQLRAELVRTDFQHFTDAIKLAFGAGIDLSSLKFIRADLKDIMKDLEHGAITDIEGLRRGISRAIRNVFFDLGGGVDAGDDFLHGRSPVEVLADGIKKAFGGITTTAAVVEVQNLAIAMKGVNSTVHEAAKQAINLSNKLQLVANVALNDFGDLGIRVAESMVSNFLAIGDAIGDAVSTLFEGASQLEKLTDQLRIQEISAELAKTSQQQEKWTEAAEATRKEMLRLELAAIQNRSAWDDLFKNLTKGVKNLIGDIVALIAKMAILKALSSLGPFGFLGSFLPLGGGGVVPGPGAGGGGRPTLQSGLLGLLKLASGGIVTGGVPGRDSVPALLQPGELVVPTDAVESALNSLEPQNPVFVQINAGLLAGDEGTAREIVRMVQEKIRFNDTGQTI